MYITYKITKLKFGHSVFAYLLVSFDGQLDEEST